MNDAHDRFAPLTDCERAAHQRRNVRSQTSASLSFQFHPARRSRPRRISDWASR